MVKHFSTDNQVKKIKCLTEDTFPIPFLSLLCIVAYIICRQTATGKKISSFINLAIIFLTDKSQNIAESSMSILIRKHARIFMVATILQHYNG